MESDSFFCQLFKQLPQTLFELLDQPVTRAKSYRFDAVELKKSFRIDGLFIPDKSSLPLYFVEVQFQRMQRFYANLFAKVFCYLEENDPSQEWVAVAIFPSRNIEPKHLRPYEDLLHSPRVKRVFLDEHPLVANPPLGLGILQLVSASLNQAESIVPRIARRAKAELSDSDLQSKVLELLETILFRRFSQFSRQEIRMKFQLHEVRDTRYWKDAHEKGIEKGIEKGKSLATQEIAENLLAQGMSAKKVAELTKMPIDEVRRLSKSRPTTHGDR